jgi:hypothetical protein
MSLLISGAIGVGATGINGGGHGCQQRSARMHQRICAIQWNKSQSAGRIYIEIILIIKRPESIVEILSKSKSHNEFAEGIFYGI